MSLELALGSDVESDADSLRDEQSRDGKGDVGVSGQEWLEERGRGME